MGAAYKYESATIIKVVVALGVVAVLCVALIGFLAWDKVPVPDALASIGGGAVGALATLLVTFTPSPLPGGRRAADAATAAPGEPPLPVPPLPVPPTVPSPPPPPGL